MKTLKSMMIAILILTLVSPTMAAQKKVPLWQKIVVGGIGVAAVGGTIYIARHEQKKEQKQVEQQNIEAEQAVRALQTGCSDNFPLKGKIIAITPIFSSQARPAARYGREETAEAIVNIIKALDQCGANVVDDPGTTNQLQRVLGGGGGQHQQNVQLPPFIISVGAMKIQNRNASYQVRTGVYDQRQRVQDVNVVVDIQVRQTMTETFSSYAVSAGTSTGMGNDNIGRQFSQTLLGGIYGTSQDVQSTTYYAVLHGSVTAFKNLEGTLRVR